MNDIIKFLNFEDDNLETTGPIVRDGKRYITIRKKLTIEFCPVCSYRMHSKGIYERTVNHPIMQDGLPLVLKVQQRRWRCTKREQEFHRRLNFTHSRDYLVIKKYPWVILKNQDDLKYSSKAFWNRVLNQYTTIYDLEERLFKIAPELKPMRNLKEKYITFNNRYGGNPRDARPALRELITLYRNSGFPEFEHVANMLEEHFEAIINSFIMIKRFCKDGEHISRLSNGPMEALNRIVKDQKRYAHGYHNFDHLRNRFLFSQRKNAQMLAIPRKREEVVPTGKPRGPYKKK